MLSLYLIDVPCRVFNLDVSISLQKFQMSEGKNVRFLDNCNNPNDTGDSEMRKREWKNQLLWRLLLSDSTLRLAVTASGSSSSSAFGNLRQCCKGRQCESCMEWTTGISICSSCNHCPRVDSSAASPHVTLCSSARFGSLGQTGQA